jgi:hypothetical protein
MEELRRNAEEQAASFQVVAKDQRAIISFRGESTHDEKP